jgi:hypothetical protein
MNFGRGIICAEKYWINTENIQFGSHENMCRCIITIWHITNDEQSISVLIAVLTSTEASWTLYFIVI